MTHPRPEQMAAQTHAAPLELKFVAQDGVFEGYASVFGNIDSAGDRIVPGAFAKSLAACRAQDRWPPMLWQHEPKQPVGTWEEMYEDSHGLYVRGRLFIEDIALAREAYALLREKVVSGLSIGYRTKESQRDGQSGARVLREVDLLEVSLVTFPANDMARIRAVKTLFSDGAVPPARDVEAFLRDAGFSRKQAKALIAHGYKALTPRDAAEGMDDNAQSDAELINDLAARLRAMASAPY